MVSFLSCLIFSSSLLTLMILSLPIYTVFWFRLDICAADTCQNIHVPPHYLQLKMWFTLPVLPLSLIRKPYFIGKQNSTIFTNFLTYKAESNHTTSPLQTIQYTVHPIQRHFTRQRRKSDEWMEQNILKDVFLRQIKLSISFWTRECVLQWKMWNLPHIPKQLYVQLYGGDYAKFERIH
jgi:hypothetical protein